jgi:arylsulfatase
MPQNVLFITADQFRADAMHCAGSEFLSTPNYDRIAGQGVRFSRALASNPICVPARATMTTGLHSHKCTGHKNNGGAIVPGCSLLAELFNDAGYQTYAMGKLHYLPYQLPRVVHGFKHWELTESGRLMQQSANNNWDIGTEEYYDYLEKVGWKNMYRAHGVGNNDVRGALSALPAEHNVDSWVVSRSIHYLQQHLQKQPDTPFFMWTSFPKPHSPFDPPEPWHRMYDPREIPAPTGSADLLVGRNPGLQMRPSRYCWDLMSPEQIQLARARYFGLVSFQDSQLGRLLGFLEKNKLLDSTAIVFTADHGELLGDFGCFFKSCFAGGAEHIPMLMRAPGIPAGQVRDALVGTEDILPTLCQLAGLPIPDGPDGKSLVPIARDGGTVREIYVAQTGDSPEQCYMAMDDRWKYCYSQLGATEELYDMLNDPGELVNLAGGSQQASRVSQMRGTVIDWCRDNDDEQMLDPGGDLVKSSWSMPKERERLPGWFGWRGF